MTSLPIISSLVPALSSGVHPSWISFFFEVSDSFLLQIFHACCSLHDKYSPFPLLILLIVHLKINAFSLRGPFLILRVKLVSLRHALRTSYTSYGPWHLQCWPGSISFLASLLDRKLHESMCPQRLVRYWALSRLLCIYSSDGGMRSRSLGPEAAGHPLNVQCHHGPGT